jgi:ubiquinone/menaquinone biosynthesis C-methylase UbiE
MEVKINLGCGNEFRPESEGWVNVDRWDYDPRVKVVDLELGKLPFENDSVDHIRATHVLEHITNLIPLMNECWRVLKVGGTFYIEVPKYPSLDCFKDPTHVRFFVKETFEYFTRYLQEGSFKMYQILPWAYQSLIEDLNQLRVVLIPVK